MFFKCELVKSPQNLFLHPLHPADENRGEGLKSVASVTPPQRNNFFMSYLLFLDESGQDHRDMPYEVRGGIALHTSKIWPFVQAVEQLERDCFGGALSEFKAELKGSKLLNTKRLRLATQSPPMPPDERRKACLRFFTKGLEKQAPTRDEFSAYGQACFEFARGAFRLLEQYQASVFAGVIPRGCIPPSGHRDSDYARKDIIFMLERYFYALEEKQEHGLLVFDEVEKQSDRRFVKKLHHYFRETQTGRYRSHWIIPAPLFVSSDMTYPVQIADLCIYAINYGYRLPGTGMDAPVVEVIAREFGPVLKRLQYRGEGYRHGNVFPTYGIVFVPDPYEFR